MYIAADALDCKKKTTISVVVPFLLAAALMSSLYLLQQHWSFHGTLSHYIIMNLALAFSVSIGYYHF